MDASVKLEANRSSTGISPSQFISAMTFIGVSILSGWDKGIPIVFTSDEMVEGG